jgi:glycosyltransferase involved in cell wall biosynthesis
MSGRALLISIRINPAHIQLLIAYAKAIQSLGLEAVFLLDPAYSRFSELGNTAPILEFGRARLDSRWDCAIFFNPSLHNLETAKSLKKDGTRILYILHEPWQMSARYIKDEGLRAAGMAILAHRSTLPVLRVADHIILPSQYGLRIYRSNDARYNRNASCIPLLYDDDLRDDISSLIQKKRYFSYIGNPCRAHGFDQFLNVVRVSLQQNRDIQFLIASGGHSLPKGCLSDPIFAQNSGRIEIQSGRRLSNDEINGYYTRSTCVWNVYRRSTQSGVLPKAFMFGAPVLCSSVGSFPEFVTSGRNGEIVSARDPECIIEAFQRFKENLVSYATHCRRDFMSTFYYRAHLRDVCDLLPDFTSSRADFHNPTG